MIRKYVFTFTIKGLRYSWKIIYILQEKLEDTKG